MFDLVRNTKKSLQLKHSVVRYAVRPYCATDVALELDI
jgi:hypothetical protein